MVLTKRELKIFETFEKNVFKEYVFNEFKTNSNSQTQKFIKKLLKNNVIISKNVGKTRLYKLNLENSLTYTYISLINGNKFLKTKKLIKKEVEKYTTFYSIIVFGSRVKSNKGNDLDVAIISDKKLNFVKKAIEQKSNNLDIQAITSKDFEKMLKSKEENLAKQIVKNHTAIHNPEGFYKIIKNAQIIFGKGGK